MTRSRTTVGKRNIQQQKHEKARAKQERKAARRASPPDADRVEVSMTESELIEELATLHGAVESGRISRQEFEGRHDELRSQLQQLGDRSSDD